MCSTRKTCLIISVLSITLFCIGRSLFDEEIIFYTETYPHIAALVATPYSIISLLSIAFTLNVSSTIQLKEWSDLRGKEFSARPSFIVFGYLLVVLVFLGTYVALVDVFSGH